MFWQSIYLTLDHYQSIVSWLGRSAPHTLWYFHDRANVVCFWTFSVYVSWFCKSEFLDRTFLSVDPLLWPSLQYSFDHICAMTCNEASSCRSAFLYILNTQLIEPFHAELRRPCEYRRLAITGRGSMQYTRKLRKSRNSWLSRRVSLLTELDIWV